ncbi:MAG: Smr/MutS family protein [Bacteroidaceae bacterium]|nr:Smr/MutS family protein [Bacteroidaceae bacterium]
MIYPSNFEHKIGFDDIRTQLVGKCLSQLGKEKVQSMEFSSDFERINKLLLETSEFVRIQREEEDFPSQYFFDLRDELKRIRLEGSYLEELALFDLKRSLESLEGIVRFLHRKDNGESEELSTKSFKFQAKEETNPYKAMLAKKRGTKRIFINGQWVTSPSAKNNDEESTNNNSEESNDKIEDTSIATSKESFRYPNLCSLSYGIAIFPQLTKRIALILDDYGKIKDSASPKLAEIRQELSRTAGSVSRALNQILRSAQDEGVIDKDTTPTMRDGRLVIPVVPGLKRKIKGIIHDESATGKTVFIEPTEVVEANNHIRELEGEEKREIIRILTDFTALIRPVVPELLKGYEFLSVIDFIRAKAIWSIESDSTLPIFENRSVIDWVQAVHPLLKKSLEKHNKKVVPLDIHLEDKQRILLISGPNAGGKSVCLKTVGLLQYMLQCGMLIPLRENSHVGIFQNIMIDIGDEQSIEDELSTYSSHLTNMKNMMKNCNSQTLLLIDEFGGGTEPQIGGALAEAMLKRFNDNCTFGIITTHYQNLKHFAEDNEGIVNGAMLYDRHLMQALYQLEIGNPGSSFAVEIARKIGIPEQVIQDASDIVGQEYINADKYLQDIVRDKRYWENKRQNIHQKEKQLEQTLTRYQTEMEELQKNKKEILRNAKLEAQELLNQSNKLIENTIREIKEAQAEKERTRDARAQVQEFQKSLSADDMNAHEDLIAKKMKQLMERQERKAKNKERKAQQASQKPAVETIAQKIKKADIFLIGDQVRLKGQTAVGTIESIQGENAVITYGSMRTNIKLKRIEKVHSQTKEAPKFNISFTSKQTQDEIYEKKLQFHQDIDVRGLRGDEAVQAVTYFIDDAILVGMSRVRILHGTGGGILRTLIRQYLGTVPGVKDYRDEHIQFGGAGITVVDLE